MDEPLQHETEKLIRAWMQHDSEMLREYLVAGVEDPRTNVQSVLMRHFLIVALSGDRYGRLMEQELRFALAMSWLRTLPDEIGGSEDLAAVRHALAIGADNAEGIAVPRFVACTYAAFPAEVNGITIPNFIDEALAREDRGGSGDLLNEKILSTFESAWNNALEGKKASGTSVLEVACGSANDCRFLDRFGVARLIGYTGLDLCDKNIANAKAMFPEANFASGNALDLGAADRAYDYCLVQDLFEHLSLPAADRALTEICRVTRLGLCLGFFNGYEGEKHISQPTDDYHWNLLSVSTLRQALESRGFTVEIVHIDTFLKWRFGFDRTHNKNAYTFFASRDTKI